MSDDIRPTNQIIYAVDIYDASHALLVDGAGALVVTGSFGPISGSVTVTNFPAIQAVSQNGTWTVNLATEPTIDIGKVDQGTGGASPWLVSVNNFPATQPISGSVSIIGTVPVSGTFFQTTQPVSIAGTVPISGAVSVSNFPSTQTITGHVITDTGSTTVVTGNVTAVQPTGSNLHVVVDGLPTISTTPPFYTRVDTFTTVTAGVTVDAHLAPVKTFALQVSGVGAPAAAWDVVLEGSLDNVHWTTILTSSGALITLPIAYDNSANLGDTSSTPYTTAPFTVSGSDIAVFLCLCFNSPAAPTVTYAGQPMTLIASVNNGVPISAYVLYNAPAGTDVFDITSGGAATRIFASSYNGVLGTDTFVTDTTNLGNAFVTIPITTTIPGDWLIALANGSSPWNSDGTVRVVSGGEYGSIADKGPIVSAGATDIQIEQIGQGPFYQNSVVVVAFSPFIAAAPEDGEVFWTGAPLFPILYFRSRVVSLSLGPATGLAVTILGM